MKRSLASVSLVLLLAAPAFAGDFEITPFVGYRVGGESFVYDDYSSQSVDIDSSANFGLMFDIPVIAGLRVELLGDYQSTDFSSYRYYGHGGPIDLGGIDVTYFQAGILYQWLDGRPVRPYVVHTLGLAHLDPELGGSTDRFSLSLGGGVKIFPTEHVGFRFEGRGFWADTADTSYWDDDYWDDCDYYDNRNCRRNDDLTQFEFSVGLIFAF